MAATTTATVRTEVENLLAYLIDSEIALHARPVTHETDRVSWRPFGMGAKFLPSRDSRATANYRHWLEMGAYSALLSDGALLQVTYEFAANTIVGHRLAYVPCPFVMDRDLLQEEPIIDLFDTYAEGRTSEVVLDSVVRFEFDRERAAPGHPAAHMTINSAHCRIACAAPLRVGQFVDFIFRHFYPDIWRLHPYFEQLPKSGFGERTVTAQETELMHMSWRL